MTRPTTPPPIDPRRHAVFLDFDGTLAPLVDDPDAVALPDGTLEPLMALQEACGGALAIVSGRKISDLDRFLSPMRFAAAGVHGLERRGAPGGTVERLMTADELDPVREGLKPLLDEHPQLGFEDKGLALVLHYRTVPHLEEAAREGMRKAVGDRDDLLVMEGDMIVEIHPAGMDKGRALEAMLGSAPFEGRVPLYAGDDTTDEYALKVVRERGGVAVKVGEKESVAEFRLSDVRAVHDWIAASLESFRSNEDH
ncbi:trehalose-phosphatase [Fulvimarina endophytica]|uniref:Trehalose 6-phosphate phosphatase n=1 Tax=Fulvimarina endophytica TaxID=2293836 RepID=A0A371WYT9_9HYPH|nr:trehalose-phosphatase [Fulvimarina endophytica]RFC62155.1 trehalose-phosphatase [Fulvimarina endophytica]